MSLYTVSNGSVINAADNVQFYNLLTGSMTDQPVTIANRIRATNTGASSNSGYMGGVNGAAPTSGTFATGDYVVDQTGPIRVCTSGGSPGTWAATGTQIGTQVLGSPAASVTFSSIPTSFRHLRLTWSARSDTAGSSVISVDLRINGDTGANYDGNFMQVVGSTVGTGIDSVGRTSCFVGKASSAGWASGSWGIGVIDLFDWNHPAAASKIQVLSRYTLWIDTTNTSTGLTGYIYIGSAPYTSLTMLMDSGNFVAGSSFTLWGC